MGRGQQGQTLLYGSPIRATGDLASRIERRLETLASRVGTFDPRSQDPDMEAVGDLERLLTDCTVPIADATPTLIPYSSWLRQGLEAATPRSPRERIAEDEKLLAALEHSRLLLARAFHRITDPTLLEAHVAAELSAGDGWRSLREPLSSLMAGTPLRHRNCPVVYRRLMEPWGKSGIRRAPEGKYLVHYSAGAGKVIGQGKALCGTSLTLAGSGGDWNSSSTGNLKVTCERCRNAVNTRPSEIQMATEDEEAQLTRLLDGVVSRTGQRVLREITTPGVVPLDVDDFVAMVRSHAWDSLLTELQDVCERWDSPLSSRTMQVLRRVPSEPERLDGLREGTIPAIVF